MNKIKELIDASVPARTISEIFSILKAYKEVFVERENGKFFVSASAIISSSPKAEDYKVFNINVNDIYTEKEQMLNYVESFASYPDNYNGKKDYAKLAFYAKPINRAYLNARWDGENIVIE